MSPLLASILCCLPPASFHVAEGVLFLPPPEWTQQAWAPVLVLDIPTLDFRIPEVRSGRTKMVGRRGMAEASVDVVGFVARPLEHYLDVVWPRLKVELKDAFSAGYGARETKQMLGQWMQAMHTNPGRWVAPKPADFWYNGSAPESRRWQGMWVKERLDAQIER